MTNRRPTLKRALGVSLLSLAALCCISSVSLVLITRSLHHTNLEISTAAERHEMTEQVLRDVTVRQHATGPSLRAQLARDIALRIDEIARQARPGQEREAAERARAAIEAPRKNSDIEADDVYPALIELGRIQRTLLADQRVSAARLHDSANVIGVSTGGLVIIATMSLLAALNRRVIRPLLGVADAMRDFGAGRIGTRAPEDGPREVGAMGRAFNVMAERLERQEDQYKVYLAGVAHDLRNPVHILRGAVSLDSSVVCEPSQATRILGIVERQLGQIERLVEDVVDTENLRRGHLTLHCEEKDVSEIARAVATLFASASKAHSIEVKADRPVRVPCDSARVEEVLTNLVSNAIKYSPNGGRVSIDVQEALPGTARIVVSDEGIGMTEKQLQRVFGAFERGASVRDKIPGRGLGLFLAKKIVEEHGGSLRAQSALGRGSSFIIELRRTLN